MTVKELYRWAIENNCEDYELNYYECGAWLPINKRTLTKEESEVGNFLDIG